MTSNGRLEQSQPHVENCLFAEYGIDTVVHWGVAVLALVFAATALGVV